MWSKKYKNFPLKCSGVTQHSNTVWKYSSTSSKYKPQIVLNYTIGYLRNILCYSPCLQKLTSAVYKDKHLDKELFSHNHDRCV